MKKIYFTVFLSVLFLFSYGTTYQILNIGITFSPSTLTINQGDVVTFTLNSILHNAIEVSQATYTADGITPLSGGFSVPFGATSFSVGQLSVGTHYYVCENHVTLGMKGIIIVQGTLAVPETNLQKEVLIYPNPAKDYLTVQYNPSGSDVIELKLFDLQGKLVNVLLQKTQVSGLFTGRFLLNTISAPGVYVIQISTGDKNSYQKVVIM